MKVKLNWDGLGIATSVACAIHCALLPLILSSLPLFGINIIHNIYFEWSMIFIAIAVGTYALYHGYLKHHRSVLPVIIFYAGCFFLITKQLVSHFYSPVLLFFAVTLIVSAHYSNYRMCNRNKCISSHHKH